MEERLFGEKWIGSSTPSMIIELVLPSKSFSGMGLMERVEILNFQTREWSRKQWVEPESTKAFSEMCENDSEVILSNKEVDEGIELALSFTSSCVCTESTQTESTQPPAHAEVSGLLTIFLSWMNQLLSRLWHRPMILPWLQLSGPLSLLSPSGSF